MSDPFIDALVRPPVRGQLFFRDAGRHGNGSRMMMVVGIVAVPEDTAIKAEHQYVVTGSEQAGLRLHVGSAVDRTQEARGMSLGGLVTQSIWRI